MSTALFVFCARCGCLFLLHLNTLEPQAASGLHRYPASFAKHHGRLLEARVRLQLLLYRDAQRDGRSTGTNTQTIHVYFSVFLLLANSFFNKREQTARSWHIDCYITGPDQYKQRLFMNVDVYRQTLEFSPDDWEGFSYSFVQSYLWPWAGSPWMIQGHILHCTPKIS